MSRAARAPSLLYPAILAALGTAPVTARAEIAADAASARKLDDIVVEAHPAAKVDSPKYTQALLDTPQTVTQVPGEVIEGQNLLGLRDILATLPGITFGAGEGGGGYGDSINLRGFSANNDITVDGLRDSAQYTRSDTFNLETVEVVNGANSVHSGAGAVGGSINLVSKTATDEEFTRVALGAGTHAYGRATLDSNLRLGESAALRMNLMAHRSDIPGRDVETEERWGFAPSIAFGLGSDTRLSLSHLHQRDDNVPQYGVPYFGGAPLPGVDPSTYFGYHNLDRQEIEQDAFTARLEHAFSDQVSISNITRQSTTAQFSLVDPPQGSYCDANGINPSNGGACEYSVSGASFTLLPGQYQPSGPRGTTRDTQNRLLVNQTDFRTDFTTAGIQHDLVTGFSLAHESFELASGNSLRTAEGGNVTLPVMDLYDPDTHWTGPVNFIRTAQQRGELDNRAVYALDTLKFGERWHLNLAARYERNEGTHRTDAIALPSAGGAVTPGPELRNDEDLFSYRGGLLYKPAVNASYYLSFGNSKSPSKASVNGACTAATCNVDPETAEVTELGAKWDLRGGRLALTAAVFRNDRSNYRVADLNNPENPSGEQQLDGQARVDGLILGAAGRLGERWMVYTHFTHLRSEVLQGVSDTDASAGLDYTRGDRLLNTPENSLGLWTTYDLGRNWQLGYGASYLGRVWLTQHGAANPEGPLVTAPGYWVHRAMAAWTPTRELRLQLNLENLFDEEYYVRPRNNGWSTPGETRSATLTASYLF